MAKKVLTGVVKSCGKMDKTVKVAVSRSFKHPKYGKIVTTDKSYIVHDPQNKCKESDVVKIQETRPISRRKSFAVVYE